MINRVNYIVGHIILLLLLGLTPLKAQILELPIITSGGNFELKTHNQPHLDYSIGESASIANYSALDGNTLNTGFIQTFMFSPVFPVINTAMALPGRLDLFPNPVSDITKAVISFYEQGYAWLEVVSIGGSVLYKSALFQVGGRTERELNLSTLTKGLYTLQIHFTSNLGVRKEGQYKIIKI